MRTRTREVQIFNMSLIDILCGALGAFCFMTLGALPFYRPPGSAIILQQNQEQTQKLLDELDRLRQSADPELAKKMEELQRRLEDQIKQLEGQVNQYASENEQLQAQNKELTEKNQQQTLSLNARNPFVLFAAANEANQDLTLYLEDDSTKGDKRNPRFDPTTAEPQGHFWSGDVDFRFPNRGVAMWLVRDSPANIHYKLYLRLVNEPAKRQTTSVISGAYGNNYSLTFPEVTLGSGRYWTRLGTLTTDSEGTGTVTFQESTQAERDAEWTKLSGSPPPPLPVPALSGTPSPAMPSADVLRKQLEEIEKERREMLRRRQSQSPGAVSPTPTP
jgi:hypothetical protein